MAKTVAKKATAKTAPAKTQAPAAVEQTKDYIVIDHPKNNEVIGKGAYSLRIGASKCDKVEISIDDQPWHVCRHSVGYWWYDWNCNAPGSHQAVARLHKGGDVLVSRRRRFKVA
jgi:hypothetical protein